MSYTVVEELPTNAAQGIIHDQIIVLNIGKSQDAYPKEFRMVAAQVEINGKEVEMTFISNNFKWAALLVWLLSRYAAFVSGWAHSFSRLMALLRSYAWEKFDLKELLQFHGTAGGLPRMVAEPGQAYFVGFEPK